MSSRENQLDLPISRLGSWSASSQGKWVFAAIAILPFLMVYLLHFCQSPTAATGFIQVDQASYLANGRAVFERGHWLLYPNPYDYSSTAPIIYFHLPMILFGVLTQIGLDPGLAYAALGVVLALLFSRVTLAVIECVLNPDGRFVLPLFLFAMWGGGLLVVKAALENVSINLPFDHDLLRLDPFAGWWFLSWGRNVIFPTESVYHLLVLGSWLAILNRHWKHAIIAVTVTCLSHPFTAVELLATVLPWSLLAYLPGSKDKPPVAFVATVIGVAVLFCGYNGWFLQRFPSHVAVYEANSFAWLLSTASALYGYLPILLAALWALVAQRHFFSYKQLFLFTAAVATFLLSKHEWFVARPNQPLHYTRGYTWFALSLIAIPRMQMWCSRLWQLRLSNSIKYILVGILLTLASLDNVVFLSKFPKNNDGMFVSATVKSLIKRLNELKARGTVICSDQALGSILATYTSLTPFIGNHNTTPYIAAKRVLSDNFFASTTGADIDEPTDFVVVNHGQKFANMSGYRFLLAADSLEVFERKLGGQ